MENETKWYENEKIVVPLIKESVAAFTEQTKNRKYSTYDKLFLAVTMLFIVISLCGTIIWLAVLGAIDNCTIGTLLAFICGTFAGRSIPRLFSSIFSSSE